MQNSALSQAEHDLPSMTIGQIATSLPGAAGVFRRHKMDFCCGGGKLLREEAERRNINMQSLLNELDQAAGRADAPAPTEVDALIDHIVTRYHAVHRVELADLLRMARRVETVHADHPDVVKGLADAIEHLALEMESHMMKEEQVLFPMMRRVLRGEAIPMIVNPIHMMRHEHDDHGENLHGIIDMTHEFTPPPTACNTWRALYLGLSKFAEDLEMHVALENNQLFPHFEKLA